MVSEIWVDCRATLFCVVNATAGAARAKRAKVFMVMYLLIVLRVVTEREGDGNSLDDEEDSRCFQVESIYRFQSGTHFFGDTTKEDLP